MWPETSTLEVVGACVCSGCAYILYRALLYENAAIEAMKAAPDLQCDTIVNQTGQVMLAGMSGFVHGTVQPVSGEGIQLSQPLSHSVHEKRGSYVTGVVSQETIKEMILTQIFGVWSDGERIINVETKSIPFYICDGNLKVQVRNALDLECVDLEVVGESYEASGGGFFSSLMALVQGVRPTGIKHTQEMLVTGTEVIGLGRLVLKSSGFYLEPDVTLPYLVSTQSRENVIQSYEVSVIFKKICYWLFGSAAAIFITRMVYRHVRRAWHDWRSRARDRAYAMAVSAAQGCDSEDLPSRLSCITCCGLRNAVFVPCAHVAVCLPCSKKVGRHCPVCREVILSTLPLIYS